MSSSNTDRPTTRLPLTNINEPEHQLREAIDPEALTELADSMAAEGLHQPIGVRGPLPDGRYEIIWGHRRYLAARLLQWDDIEAKTFPPTYDPLLAAVSENLQRADLTPVEEAHAVQRMLERGHSVASVSRLFRRSPSWVHARVNLLNLPEDLQGAVQGRALSLAVATGLAEIDHDGYRRQLIDEARRTGATADTVAVWAAHYRADRDRIIHNSLTVEELSQARANFVVYYSCDACGQDADYRETKAFRFCPSCGDSLARGLAGAGQPGEQRATT